jgi:hypothetical protein
MPFMIAFGCMPPPGIFLHYSVDPIIIVVKRGDIISSNLINNNSIFMDLIITESQSGSFHKRQKVHPFVISNT